MNHQLILGITKPRFESILPQLPQGRSLADARTELISIVDAGDMMRCPCCDQQAKRYSRDLSPEMARVLCDLIRIVAESGEAWIDIKDIDVRGGDYAKLRYWGLAESGDPANRNSGHWRPTSLGVEFANGLAKVPSHAYLYDGRLLGFTARMVTIHDVLGPDLGGKQ